MKIKYRSIPSFLFLLAAILVVFIGSVRVSFAQQDINLTGYTLTFHDEFTESALNLSNYGPISTTQPAWIAHTPYGGDFGDGAFTTSAYSISNGILSIIAQNNGSGWTCGLLSSVDTSYNGFSQTYGYFEARMLLPAGMGTWPAFWLGGIAPSGTPSPEIDVFEMYGAWPTIVHETYHTWLNNQETQVNYTTATISDSSVNWHIYGVLVTPSFITWYIDGVQVFQIATPAAAKVPLYVMVDYALGGGWGESGVGNPSVTQVDWVRVYQLPSSGNVSLTGQDIGAVGVAGSDSLTSGVYTIKASGSDIWGSSDTFRFLYQPMTGDGSIVARAVTVDNTNGWAKAGVMMRNTLDANSANSFMMTENAEYRSVAGGGTTAGSGGYGAPSWVKVTRAGNVFTTYTSSDGVAWYQTSTQTTTMNSTIYVGLAVCAHNNAALTTVTMDSVSISGNTGGSAPASPAGLAATAGNAQVALSWSASTGATSYNVYRGTTAGGESTTAIATGISSTSYTDTGVTNGTAYYYKVAAVNTSGTSGYSNEVSATPIASYTGLDIGAVGVAGSNSLSNGVYTIKAGGADIWGSADAFRFVYQPMTGDGSIVARVVTVDNTNGWAKAGVMMRNTLDANSANSFMMTENAEYRSVAGGGTTAGSGGYGAPSWVKVTRAGSVFTTYTSSDGATWYQTSTQTTTMNSTIYVGMAVCSHNSAALTTVTMDNVTIGH